MLLVLIGSAGIALGALTGSFACWVAGKIAQWAWGE